MSNQTTNPTKQMTQEIGDAIVANLVAHYEPMLSIELLIENRKGIYALVINSKDTNGSTIESLYGTQVAKDIVAVVLDQLSAPYATIATEF